MVKTLFAAVLLLAAHCALAEGADPCMRFKWDVANERALMKEKPQALAAAVSGGAAVPTLVADTLYEVTLAAQSDVKFVLPPERAARHDAPRAGLLRFRLEKAGVHRISISTSHWIDVLDDSRAIESRDFNGQPGCERPHKVVEFDLPADRELWLQLSGVAEASILLAITPVSASRDQPCGRIADGSEGRSLR